MQQGDSSGSAFPFIFPPLQSNFSKMRCVSWASCSSWFRPGFVLLSHSQKPNPQAPGLGLLLPLLSLCHKQIAFVLEGQLEQEKGGPGMGKIEK